MNEGPKLEKQRPPRWELVSASGQVRNAAVERGRPLLAGGRSARECVRALRRADRPIRLHRRSPPHCCCRCELPDAVDPGTDSQTSRSPRGGDRSIARAATTVGAWLVVGRCGDCASTRSTSKSSSPPPTNSSRCSSPYSGSGSSCRACFASRGLQPGSKGVIDHGRAVSRPKTAMVHRRGQ